MNGKKFLLDTNIIIGLFANELSIINKVKNNNKIFVPSIVIGELFYGAEKSKQKKENIRKIHSFSRASAVFGCDVKTGSYYGYLKSKLKSKGTPIPENDIWIAAIALQHGLILVTRDKHFFHIDGLSIEKW